MKWNFLSFSGLFLFAIIVNVDAQKVSYSTIRDIPPKFIVLCAFEGGRYPYSNEIMGNKKIVQAGINSYAEVYPVSRLGLFANYFYGRVSKDASKYTDVDNEYRIGAEFYLFSKLTDRTMDVDLKTSGYSIKTTTYVSVPAKRKVSSGITFGYQRNIYSYDYFGGVNFTFFKYAKISTYTYGKKHSFTYLKSGFDILFNDETAGLIERNNKTYNLKNDLGYRFYLRFGRKAIFFSIELGKQSVTYVKYGIGIMLTPMKKLF